MTVRFYALCAPRSLVSSIQKRSFQRSSIAMAAGIINAIKHDHRELEAYYDRIVKSADADEQTRYQNQFTWVLARHSIGEELVVYPALERYVKGGAELACKDREEHQKVSKSSQPV
jgi:hemerythrin superfamily protein